MDWQTLFNLAFGIVCGFVGWFTKTIYDANKELRDDLNNLRVHLPEKYVAKHDFERMSEALFKKLDRIENKLDQKADKE